MVPSKIYYSVPISVNKAVIDAKQVPSKVPRQKNTVPLIDFMIDLGIEIVEIGFVVHIEQWKEKVRIRSSSPSQKGRSVFKDGAFYQQSTGHCANTAIHL